MVFTILDFYLLHQPGAVLFDCIAPHEGVFIGFRLYLRSVNVLHRAL